VKTEKRKNDDQGLGARRTPWLFVFMAFLLGAVAMFVVMAISTSTPVAQSSVQFVSDATFDANINAYATGTAIYAERTQDAINAQSGNMNPFEITATYIIGEATLQAFPFMQGTLMPGG
jgi:hypothetical protein